VLARVGFFGIWSRNPQIPKRFIKPLKSRGEAQTPRPRLKEKQNNGSSNHVYTAS
jgi:hypothetical protein